MSERVLFVASSGGHLDELVQLRPRLVGPNTEVTWVTFDTAHSRSLLTGEQKVVYIDHIGPRGYLRLLLALIPALRILRRTRPQAVYSTGAAIALAFLPLAFLVRARAVYIESAARIDGPSQSGKLVALLPWIHLRTQYRSWAGGRWQYGGSVLDGLSSHDTGRRRPVRRLVVTLGTQPRYPFVSLVQRIAQIAPSDVEIFWQVGPDFPAEHRPAGARDLVPATELHDWIGSADAVVAHAGVGSTLTILRAGHKPVLVPRRAERHEHVDDHQAQLVGELIERDLVIAAEADALTWEQIVESTGYLVEPRSLRSGITSRRRGSADRSPTVREGSRRAVPVSRR